MRIIYSLKVVDNQVYIHFGYARQNEPNLIIGSDSRLVSFTYQNEFQTIAIQSFGPRDSGLEFAPYHCSDGVQSGDETDLDCGGSCTSCRALNEAAVAMSIKTYYDLEGQWEGIYLIHSIPVLVWIQGQIAALYAYADVNNPNQIEGYDSRVFDP